MAFDKNMADGTPPGTGPENAPSGSKPSDFEKKSPFPPGTKFTDKGRPIWPGAEGWAAKQKSGGVENPSKTEKPNPADYPPGTLFTKSGKPIFRVAGGADDEPDDSDEKTPGPDVNDPSDIYLNQEEVERFRRERANRRGVRLEDEKSYEASIANEGRDQSFYNIYQELEHYKLTRDFGKLRQRVNNILATLDIDEAGEAPGVGEMLQYINVVFAEPQYEAFRSEISNWIEARQITHNVAFAAKYLKSEQWGSGITNIRGRHLKALMEDAGVDEASTLLEAHNEEGEGQDDVVTGARGYYYRVKDDAVDEDQIYDPEARDDDTNTVGKLVSKSKLDDKAKARLGNEKTLFQKILDAKNGDYSELTAKEKKASWSLRHKLKLVDQMWDSFGVDSKGNPKDFLGMTNVYKLAGLKDFPDRSRFYSDEGVFETHRYQEALKEFYGMNETDPVKRAQRQAEMTSQVADAKNRFKKLLVYGMNYMIKTDSLDKYHSAHRALNRIKQDGDEGDAQKAGLLIDKDGKKIMSNAVKQYFDLVNDLDSKFAEHFNEIFNANLDTEINTAISAEAIRRSKDGEPELTEDEKSELIEATKKNLAVRVKDKIHQENEDQKDKFFKLKHLNPDEVKNLDRSQISDIELEDIEQVFGQLNRAFVIAEKIHHASGQSAEFDGVKWKQNIEIPEEMRGDLANLGYINAPGGSIVVDPILEYDDDETRKFDPQTGRKIIGSGTKVKLHLATDMMPIKDTDSEEVKRRKKIAVRVAREKSGLIAAAWSKAYRELYIKYSDLIDYDGSIGGRGARDKKKLHHKPADYWNAGELNSGKYKELRRYGYVNTVMIQQFFELGTNKQLAAEWDRFFNRIKYNTGRWNAMEKVQGMFDKSGPRLLYDFHAMNDPEHLVKTLGEFYKASLALTEFNNDHGDTEVQEFIGDLAKGIIEFRVKNSTDYGHKNLNYNQIDLIIEKLELAHIVEHAVPDQLSYQYLGPEWYRIFRSIYERVDKPGAFGKFIAELIKQFNAASQAFIKG